MLTFAVGGYGILVYVCWFWIWGVLVVSLGLVLMFVCGLAQYTLDSSDFVGLGFGCFSVLASVLVFVAFAEFDAVLVLLFGVLA